MAAQSLPARTGSVKPRVRGLKSLLTYRAFRRASQIFFLAFIGFFAVQHVIIGEDSGIVTASAEAFCPLGGLETLYKYLSTGGSYVAHTHLSNVVILVAVLVTALLTRSAFCGWVCPLGFLQDLVSNLSGVIQKRSVRVRRLVTRLKKQGTGLAKLDHYLRFLKYLVLAWTVGGAAYYGVMVFRDYDPWSALLNLTEASFTFGTLVLIITLAASFFVERPWCRYACPLGAASGLVSKLSPVYLKREASACKVCKVCTTACPMGIDVHTATVVKSVDCISCLECVSACPRDGALEVKVGWPIISK